MQTSTILRFAVVTAMVLFIGPVFGKIFMTKDDALKEAFPDASAVERQDVFLSDADVKQIETLSKAKVGGKLFTFYRAENQGRVLGYAFIGTRIVRTKTAVCLVVIQPGGSVSRVKILAFNEPEEYLPAKNWFNQFCEKVLNDDLWPRKEIHAVTGATMSVEAFTQEVRKALAIFEIMVKRPDSLPLGTRDTPPAKTDQ